LLFPEFGVSSSRGIELGVPWYWNIAPNQDAIIEPRYMERRGLALGGNYRYLTRSTRGTLTGNYLPDDDVIDEDRYQYRYQQLSSILPNLYFDVDFQDISDSDYFNDFSNNLGSTSQTHIDRNTSLNYSLKNWSLRALVQDFKTIDESTAISDRPYTRLPQITFNGDTVIADSPVLFTLDSELVDFRHDDDTKTTGIRMTLRPGLYMPLSGAAWFFNPAIKFSHTQYNVGTDGNTAQPGTEQDVDDRNLPMASIDTGLFFERQLDSGYQQTLEPRLFYLNVPFEDQNNTPIFDTSFPEFSFAQLFRDNRFVGGDRVGDANQLTLALTSRVLNPDSGDELLRASIGQIYYFEDRKVSLDGTVDTDKQSDIIAELASTWSRWTGRIDLQWDINNDELSRENYFLHYKSDDRNLFNIGYRKRLDDQQVDIEQTDTSLVYAITDQYSTVARWNYSLQDDRSIDIIAGLAYDNCCWSIQLLAQHRLKNTTLLTTETDEEYDNAILVQLVFKGLGSLSGSKARTTLEQSIYGYTDTLQ
jgi:LPS-assembly protein